MTVSMSESPGYEITDPHLKAQVVRAIDLALARAGLARAEVSLSIVNDEAIRRLNRDYRNVDRPTDVLSFSLWEGEDGGSDPFPPEALPPEAGVAGPVPPTWGAAGEPLLLGDVVISLDRARAQADEYGHGLAREFCFLAVHGTLHLLGYDHGTSEAEAVMMAEAEAVLSELGLGRAE